MRRGLTPKCRGFFESEFKGLAGDEEFGGVFDYRAQIIV